MIVIVKQGQAELIEAPQDSDLAWELADLLAEISGVPHWVGKI